LEAQEVSEAENKRMTDRQLLGLLLERIKRLELYVEDQQRETQLMLERIHKELVDRRLEFQERFEKIEHQIEALTLSLVNVRSVQRGLDKRLNDLER
jgi:hypothetical protein